MSNRSVFNNVHHVVPMHYSEQFILLKSSHFLLKEKKSYLFGEFFFTNMMYFLLIEFLSPVQRPNVDILTANTMLKVQITEVYFAWKEL